MKKLFALLTCVMLLLTLLPLGAVSAADAAAPVVVGGVPLQEGDYLAVGATAPQTTKPTGGYAHYKDGTLTLNNYTYEGSGYQLGKDSYVLIKASCTLRMHLIGNNSLSDPAPYGYVDGIDAGHIIITAESGATLNLDVNRNGMYASGNCIIKGGTITIRAVKQGIYIPCGYLYLDWELPAWYLEVPRGLTIENAEVSIKSNGKSISAYDVHLNGATVNATSNFEEGLFVMDVLDIKSSAVIAKGGTVGIVGNTGRSTVEHSVVTAEGGSASGIQGGLTLNGATVTATGKTSGLNGRLTVNDGTVIATGGENGINLRRGNILIHSGTVIATGKKQSAIYVWEGDILINGGRVSAICKGDGDTYSALKSYSGKVVINEDLYQVGSYAPDGELIPYDPADNKLYDRVVVCGEHIYDGVCDGECNHCGTARTVKAHTWKNGKCAVCGKASPTKVKLTAQSATARYAKAGATVSAKVTAKGDGLQYRWYVKNAGGTKYSKSSITKAAYSVSMSAKVKGRRVYCIVTDKYGNKVQSKTFILRESVSITAQPKTVAVKKNATAKVTVKAKGDGLRYQWYVKNAGAAKYTKSSVKTATYRTTMTAKAKNRLLLCIITDKYGNKVQTKTVKLKMK